MALPAVCVHVCVCDIPEISHDSLCPPQNKRKLTLPQEGDFFFNKQINLYFQETQALQKLC